MMLLFVHLERMQELLVLLDQVDLEVVHLEQVQSPPSPRMLRDLSLSKSRGVDLGLGS